MFLQSKSLYGDALSQYHKAITILMRLEVIKKHLVEKLIMSCAENSV